MIKLILANWVILTPIGFLSVVSLAIILERVAYYTHIKPPRRERLLNVLNQLGKLPARELLSRLDKRDQSPEKKLFEVALTMQFYNREAYKQRLSALRDGYLDKMEQRLALLPGLGNVATLLGLFGTVWGMIQAFTRMNEVGSSDPYILAGGISQALVTTAAGLVVAIPAMFFHSVFGALVERHADRMDRVVNECLFKLGAADARKRETKRTY